MGKSRGPLAATPAQGRDAAVGDLPPSLQNDLGLMKILATSNTSSPTLEVKNDSVHPVRAPGSRVPRVVTGGLRVLLALIARLISGASVRWVNCQPDTCQRVYFANHTSHLDAVVIWAALPSAVRAVTRPVAAKDYWVANPVRRYLACEVFNALLIDRQEIKIHHSPIAEILEAMGDKYSVIIFPEGGRTLGPDVAPFKSGLYYLAKRRPDLELVPVYLDNMNRILPRGEFLPVPLLTRVIFGPPMWLENGEPKQAFLERARQAVVRLREL
ncbi:1-acyl-sn-glycerol-3-phosphate acyltransferase [Thermogutta terrifontis]|uniref:1-acyl-sn-glycerol-3-phosphate acyltransferase n=1 Tax=Thermogutta terrifontis TaxID=1331910 RepID=A0A286RHN4_9BACT|nr:lysophospholipid acyltransferase family protein [Thermogutta terrifontis]ASV75463.1 1-acyl-sn-glycerol-3-phosphate acyltransferase [Thermogutta terrifontis]